MNTLQVKIGMDINGNKLAKVSSTGRRGFSIQTNGNLPYCHRLGIGDVLKDGEPHTRHGIHEVVSYVFEHGTETQRAFFGLQNTKKQALTAVL